MLAPPCFLSQLADCVPVHLPCVVLLCTRPDVRNRAAIAAWLKALSLGFPSLAAQGKTGPLYYMFDHIEHDETRHLPDLVDGYLGRLPGSKWYILESGVVGDRAAADLIDGIDRSIAFRLAFYDHMLVLLERYIHP